MEELKIPQLLEYAWDHLILLPAAKDQGKREERKQFLLRKIKEGRPTDLAALPIQQLKNYVRLHRIPGVTITDNKQKQIVAIENYLKRPTKKEIVVKAPGRYETGNLWFNILLRTRLALVFRLAQLSSFLREQFMKEYYWRQRLALEGFHEPRGERNWRLHYLEVTNYPLAGDVYGKGDNTTGTLGFQSRKVNIIQPTRADISDVIDFDFFGLYYIAGLSVFLRSNGRVYLSGRVVHFSNDQLETGWLFDSSVAQKLSKRAQLAPPQLINISEEYRFDRVRLARDFIFLLSKRQLYCFDLHIIGGRAIFDSTTRNYTYPITERNNTLYPVLPPHLIGKIVSFAVRQVGFERFELILLDDEGRVHRSSVVGGISGVRLSFTSVDLTHALFGDGTYGKNPRVVRLGEVRAKGQSFVRVILFTEDNKSFDFDEDIGSLFVVPIAFSGYDWRERSKKDHFILQVGNPYPNSWIHLYSIMERIFPLTEQPHVEL